MPREWTLLAGAHLPVGAVRLTHRQRALGGPTCIRSALKPSGQTKANHLQSFLAPLEAPLNCKKCSEGSHRKICPTSSTPPPPSFSETTSGSQFSWCTFRAGKHLATVHEDSSFRGKRRCFIARCARVRRRSRTLESYAGENNECLRWECPPRRHPASKTASYHFREGSGKKQTF